MVRRKKELLTSEKLSYRERERAQKRKVNGIY
jgi:hypothetical protein